MFQPDGMTFLYLALILCLAGRGIKKVLAVVPDDVKGAAKNTIIGRINRMG